jgi:N-acetylglutamate synthase-like GNAT family acetyltransferase
MPRGSGGGKSMLPSLSISDLRQRPEFFDAVSDRIWRAWWKDDSYPLGYIAGRLRENIDTTPIPFALVAHEGATFLGTASVIASDLAERPQFTPWVAAVWVEPQARQHGIGAALVDRATRDGFALGIDRLYLCARPQRSRYYERLGWKVIEQEIGPRQVNVLARDRNSAISSQP